MDFAALINLYFERSGALQSYWTLYVVIVGGLLAFSSLRKEPDLVTTALVAVLFSFFAYKNLGAIVEVTEQKFAILEGLKVALAALGDQSAGFPAQVLATLNPAKAEDVKQFHLVADLLTVVTVVAMEFRRRRAAKN